MQAVSTLTTRCLLLRNGMSVLQGSPRDVIAACLEDGRASELFFSAPPSAERPTVTRVEIETSEPNNTHTHGKPLRLTFEVTTAVSIRSAAFSFQIVDSLLRPVVHLMVVDSDRPFGRTPGTYRLTCQLPHVRLYLGRYSVTTHLAEGRGGEHFQTIEGVCPFEVVMHGHEREWPWQEGACLYMEDGCWKVETIESSMVATGSGNP
jgi:lipopolysaccharide transport system ATP-binding protein